MGFIDVTPEPVSASGRATAATASTWETWAGHSETLLRNAASGASEGVVTGAFEEFLGALNPLLKGIAAHADAQGSNAVSATGVVVAGDGQGAVYLNQAGAQEASSGSALRRPIVA